MGRLYFGNKRESSKPDGNATRETLSPIHVQTAVEALDKEYPGTRRIYDELSEIAHPNGESPFHISEWADVGAVSLDPAGVGGTLLETILSAIRVDIASDYLTRWEGDLAPRMGQLWREVHNIPPVENRDESK